MQYLEEIPGAKYKVHVDYNRYFSCPGYTCSSLLLRPLRTGGTIKPASDSGDGQRIRSAVDVANRRRVHRTARATDADARG